MIRRPLRPSATPLLRRTSLKPIGTRGIKRRAQYAEYLKSPWWRDRRAAFIAMLVEHDALRCGACGKALTPYTVDVHHKRYRLGREEDRDLMPACRGCHQALIHWYKRA